MYNYEMRNLSFAPEEYFHIYNRGTDKREIFSDQKDYERFLESLYLFNSSERIILKTIPKNDRFSYERDDIVVDIGAYCLMSNHFHLLIKSKEENSVSIFMQKLQTAYTMYYNKKYKRSGVLFQGSFKAQHVTRDEYLKYLFSYIHLNPIKIIEPNWKEKGISNLSDAKNFLDSYKYSSYSDYLTENRKERSILNKEVFPEYFTITKNFDDFINFWLTFKEGIEKYI